MFGRATITLSIGPHSSLDKLTIVNNKLHGVLQKKVRVLLNVYTYSIIPCLMNSCLITRS